MKTLFLPLLCLAALGFGQSSSAVTVMTNAPVSQIVTLRAGVDVDGLIQEFNLHPAFIYRRALHGFAAALDSAASEQLKQDPRVLTLAAGKAASIVTLKPETDPAALVQEFKLQPRFVYGAWPRPQWWRGNQFKGFADALDAATLAKLDQDNRILAVEPDGQITLLGTQVVPAGSMPPGQTVPAGLLRMVSARTIAGSAEFQVVLDIGLHDAQMHALDHAGRGTCQANGTETRKAGERQQRQNNPD